jgi:phosphohistidine phosphatase SixA
VPYYHHPMNTPGVARGRRAFLAPIWIAAVSALVAGTVLFVGIRLAVLRFAEISTVIVLRHAEKLDSTDGAPLSPQGVARAERLAAMLGGPAETGPVRAIYSSDLRRARDTVAPLAARLSLPVIALPARDIDALLARLRREGRGATSVVVGHSDTVPQIVAGLTDGRVEVGIEPEDFGSLFIVTVSSFGPPSVLRLRY